MSVPVPNDVPPASWTPNLEECQEARYSIDLGPSDRLVIRLNEDPHEQIVEFAVVQQTLVGGTWEEVLRVDTAHAEVHVHHFRRAGGESREVLATITGPNDVTRGYDEAYAMVLAGWNDNVRRWRDG